MAPRIHFIYVAVFLLAFVTLVLYRDGKQITESAAPVGGKCRAMFEISKPNGKTWSKGKERRTFHVLLILASPS